MAKKKSAPASANPPPDDEDVRQYLNVKGSTLLRPHVDMPARLDNPDGWARLRGFLQDDEPAVRAGAVITLVSIGRLDEPGLAETAASLIGHPSIFVHKGAADALAQMSGPAALLALQNLRDDPDSYLRALALRGLACLGDSSALDALVALLNDPDVKMRDRAVTELGKLNDPAVSDRVWACLQDPEYSVRVSALIALKDMKHPEYLRAVWSMANDPARQVRSEVESAIRKLRDPEMADRLLALMAENSDEEIRKAALTALAKHLGEPGFQGWLAALHDPDTVVRELAVYAGRPHGNLPNVRYMRASDPADDLFEGRRVEQLIEVMKNDPADTVRATVVLHLSDHKSEATVESIITALADRSADVRQAAVIALGELKEASAVGPMAALFDEAVDSQYEGFDTRYKRFYTQYERFISFVPEESPERLKARLKIIVALYMIGTPESKAAMHDLLERLHVDSEDSGDPR